MRRRKLVEDDNEAEEEELGENNKITNHPIINMFHSGDRMRITRCNKRRFSES